MSTNIPIMIVEYWDRCYKGTEEAQVLSPTNKPILDLVKGYKHIAFVQKYNDGGGYELAEVADEHKFPIENIRMVGVNRSYCVFQTAAQLMDIQHDKKIKNGTIEVVRGASACNYSGDGLDSLKALGVKLVNRRRKKLLTLG